MPRKPEPAGVLEIAETLQLAPGDLLYLGDTAVDMQTASSAGCIAIGVLWGFREAEELWENGAQHLIETPLELLELLPPSGG